MAIDYGKRRIGIAVSTSGVLATPHSVIQNQGDEELTLGRLAAVTAELEAETIVLGIPRQTHADQVTETFYARLADRLRQRTCKTVILWDEAYSTTEAAELQRQAGRKRQQARKEIDMQAAAVILQSYLDSEHRRTS